MELWWRTAALQALAACVQGPLAQAPRSAQGALHKRAAALLKPTLDVLTAHAALQVRNGCFVGGALHALLHLWKPGASMNNNLPTCAGLCRSPHAARAAPLACLPGRRPCCSCAFWKRMQRCLGQRPMPGSRRR